MKNNDLYKLSREKAQINGKFALFVFFMMTILISAIIATNLLLDNLIVIFLPILILPIAFAFQNLIVISREETNITFSLFVNSVTQFFSPRFIGTYSFWKSLLKSFLIYIAIFFISSIVVNLSFYNSNFMNFKVLFDEITAKEITVEAIENFITTNKELFNFYRIFITVPALSVSSLFAFYFFSISSISYFMRISAVKYPGPYITSLHRDLIRKCHRKFISAYFALNYPFYILFIIGMIGGGLFGYFLLGTSNAIYTFSLIIALFISFNGYGFKYLANKEAIYFYMLDDYRTCDRENINEIQRQIEAMKIDQEQYNNLLKQIEKLRDDRKNQEDNNDENES